MSTVQPRRTYRFAPGDDRRRLEAASDGPFDVVIIDLEDGVAAANKERARGITRSALASTDQRSTLRMVRVNGLDTAEGRADLQLVSARPTAFVLPKIRHVTEVREADEQLTAAEADAGIDIGSTELYVMVEQASSLLRAHDLLAATPRITGAFFGPADFTADVGFQSIVEGRFRYNQTMIEHAVGLFIVACAAAGVRAISSLTIMRDTSDRDSRLDEVRRLFALGFDGLAVLDDDDAALVAEASRPNLTDIAFARGVIDAYARAQSRGSATANFNGATIRAPNVAMARALLSRVP